MLQDLIAHDSIKFLVSKRQVEHAVFRMSRIGDLAIYKTQHFCQMFRMADRQNTAVFRPRFGVLRQMVVHVVPGNMGSLFQSDRARTKSCSSNPTDDVLQSALRFVLLVGSEPQVRVSLAK